MNTLSRLCSILAVCACMDAALAVEPAPLEGHSGDRETLTFPFRYDARELQTREGAGRVYRKLVRAARQQCTTGGTLLTELRRVDKQCVAELVEDGVERAGSVLLTEVHRGAGHTVVTAGR